MYVIVVALDNFIIFGVIAFVKLCLVYGLFLNITNTPQALGFRSICGSDVAF